MNVRGTADTIKRYKMVFNGVVGSWYSPYAPKHGVVITYDIYLRELLRRVNPEFMYKNRDNKATVRDRELLREVLSTQSFEYAKLNELKWHTPVRNVYDFYGDNKTMKPRSYACIAGGGYAPDMHFWIATHVPAGFNLLPSNVRAVDIGLNENYKTLNIIPSSVCAIFINFMPSSWSNMRDLNIIYLETTKHDKLRLILDNIKYGLREVTIWHIFSERWNINATVTRLLEHPLEIIRYSGKNLHEFRRSLIQHGFKGKFINKGKKAIPSVNRGTIGDY